MAGISGRVLQQLATNQCHPPAATWDQPARTLQEQVQQRDSEIRLLYNLSADADLPSDLLFASGSGLDPHISPEAAQLQINRVAQERGLSEEQVANLVEKYIEPAQFGLLGEPRVNVLLIKFGVG